jgi:hypothetical protein
VTVLPRPASPKKVGSARCRCRAQKGRLSWKSKHLLSLAAPPSRFTPRMAETATQEKTLRVKMNAEWHPHKHRCIQVRTEGQMPARLIVQVPECGCRLRVTPGSAPRQRLTVNLSKISRKQGCVRCLGMELRDPDLEDAERDDVEERRSQLRDAGYQRHDIAVVLNRCYHDSLAPEEAWVKPGVAGVYFLCCLCSAEETRADPDAAAAPIGHDPADGPATPSFTSLSAYERHVVTHSVWWTTPLHCLAPPAVGADGRCIDAATARELLRTDAPTNNLHAAAGTAPRSQRTINARTQPAAPHRRRCSKRRAFESRASKGLSARRPSRLRASCARLVRRRPAPPPRWC